MKSSVNHVSSNTEDLQKYCTQLEQQNAELAAKVQWFEEQFRLNRHRQFGASSEQTNPQQQQLFNEAEVEAKPAPEPNFEKITYQRRKQVGKREEQLKDLPVEVIEYRLPLEDQTCSCCGHRCMK
jgi:transposase